MNLYLYLDEFLNLIKIYHLAIKRYLLKEVIICSIFFYIFLLTSIYLSNIGINYIISL